jgi:hypothetical protein
MMPALVMTLCLLLGGAQDAPKSAPPGAQAPPPAASPAPETVIDGTLVAELTNLSPGSPRAYFLLAERVADLASERGDETLRRLARQLAVLSYELTKRGGGIGGGAVPGGVDDSARSVCLLLASIAPSPQEARWLRALAGTFDHDVLGGVYDPPSTGPTRDEAALDAATVLGLVRTGQGRRADRLLHKSGVSELLVRHEKLLSPAGLGGEFDRLKRTIADWPTCPQCRGKRVITKLDNNGRLAGVTICDTCGGLPGPRMSPNDLVYQLRLEALLLSGVQRSWSGQILVDGGAPLRELDADELAARFGVDPAKPLWRDGVWTGDGVEKAEKGEEAPGAAPAPAPAPAPPSREQ